MKNVTIWEILQKAISAGPRTPDFGGNVYQPQPISPWTYLFETFYTKNSGAGTCQQWLNAPHIKVLAPCPDPVAFRQRHL